MNKCFKSINSSNYVLEWKSKGVSDESIEPPSAPNDFLDPSLDYYGSKIRLEFSGSYLKQGKTTYNHREIANIYIVCETSKNYNISSYPTLEKCLFGVVSLNNHVDINSHKYSGYGIGFDKKGFFYTLVVELVEM